MTYYLPMKQLLSLDAVCRAKHDYENVFLKSYKDIAKLIQRPLNKASISVLGCGYNYPEVILFSSIAQSVVGIDTSDIFYRDGPIEVFRYIRNKRSGTVKSLLKTMLIRYKDYKYYHYLEKKLGAPIEHQKYRLLSYDGHHIPLKDQSSDAVISNAVLEHVNNLERFFQEGYRITKKQGIVYHFWHNYYSFSGGHIPESVSLKFPWGHLRGKRETHTSLNKLTPNEIENHLSKYFDIVALYQADKKHQKKGVDDNFQFEREELLTESIRNELQAIPKEILLTRSYLIIGKKR